MSNEAGLDPIKPQPRQEEFLTSAADVTIFGGAAGGGKTFSELLAPLININDTNFNAIFFRRTYPELIVGGGIWDTSKKIYPRFNAVPNETKLTWEFPSGAKIKFSHLQYDSDVHKHQSAAYPLIVWDELSQFSQYQFFYLLSRNRAPTYYNKSCWCIAASNAEPGWLADLIAWWWDPQVGYAIPERSGQLRYFTREDDRIIWVDKDYRDSRGNRPKSVTFIPSYLDDNQILKQNDPRYESNLLAQDTVTRERLLKGNWLITYSGGMFDQKWFKKVQINQLPADLKKIRYWDFAATEANENNNPDWTCGVLMGEKSGDIYILDVERFREAPGTTIQNVISCAERDGAEVSIRWEEEKGSAGRFNSSHLIGKLLGYDAQPDPVSGDKIERGKPLAAAAEHGHVFILDAKWNSLYTSEAGSFGSGRGKKDQIDASNGALKCLCLQKRVWNNFNISKTKKYQIEWNQSSTHTHNYGALVQLEDNSIYFLACLWDSIDTRLYIYHSGKYTSVLPELIISDIYKAMNLKVQGNHKLFGNDLLLSEGRSISRLLNEELRKKSAKVSITFPVMFDLNGSIVYMLSMFNSDVVMVHKDLAEASAQFAGWSYKEGKHKPEEGYGYCECLCLIASELKKQLQKEHKEPVNRDYHPKEKPKEAKTTWQTV